MPEHVLYGRRKLCYTEVTDFTDFVGIGGDPMYKRFDSVLPVINKNIPEEYRDFLAQPLYDEASDQISWYVREWSEDPEKFNELNNDAKERYRTVRDKTIAKYREVLATLNGEDALILSDALKNADSEDFLFCYDGKVTVVSWGMAPDTMLHRAFGTIIHGFDFQKKRKIRFDEGTHGTFKTSIDGKMTRPDGSVLTERDLPTVTAKNGYAFRCWTPNPVGFKVTSDMVFTALYDKVEVPVPTEEETVTVHFISDSRGHINGAAEITIPKGTCLDASMIPGVTAVSGCRFTGWDRPTDNVIDCDTTITAQYEDESVNCYFDAGENGSLSGNSMFTFPFGSAIPAASVPLVTPKKGYRFVGWDISPTELSLDHDTTFHALYEKEEKLPWYRRLWLFFNGKGCLKWLLWLLLLILLIFLLAQLFKSCEDSPEIGGSRLPETAHNGVIPSEEIITDDGRAVDNNGSVEDIVAGNGGSLPADNVIAPITGGTGPMPPVSQTPGAPDVIANRLNIYFEDEGTNLDQFAADFKNVYPGVEYKIIGADRNVEMIQIEIPESQRDIIRENLSSQLPDYKFFVVDESIIALGGHETMTESPNAGWHLKAINLREGWNITKGSEDVIVAVVDDGIDASHEILKGKIVNAYNVFTQDNHLSTGVGHGTHVAGLAVGLDKRFDEGVSGVAPKCKLMPVQVFDNDMTTFSAMISGIMYAIHKGADVVNVSIGPQFAGLDLLPEADQQFIADTQFKNEEKVWRKVINSAYKKKCILVLSTGNDDILACVPPECRTNATLNVSAVDKDFKVTEFSNYGSAANISAPGQEIKSSIPGNQYKIYDGTSMSAPIVSGTVALMKSLNRDITIDEVIPILQQSGRGVTGNIPPMVQVDRALQMQRDGSVSHSESSGNVSQDAPEAQQTDYAAIRRLIEEYKQKISDLEKLLPENNN